MPIDRPVLKVEHLTVAYDTARGPVTAVSDVSFEIRRGETLGIVGESGCGKSSVAFAIVNFLGRNGKVTDGSIVFQGQDLRGRSRRAMSSITGNQMAMVYQDPMQALNPALRVGDQMDEVLIVHQSMRREEARRTCIRMLERVCMPDPVSVLSRYPHQLSGGQQQRVLIAMSLLNNPALLIMDEPTTALDVTVEAAVLDLVDELSKEFETAVMFISHNLGVIARVSDHVGVMYAGEMVELGPVNDSFLAALHPYTQGLLRCVPRLGTCKEDSYLYPIPGQVPPPDERPSGCVFEPRCAYSEARCTEARPEMWNASDTHTVRCWRAPEIKAGQLVSPIAGITLPVEINPRNRTEETAVRVVDVHTHYRQEDTSLASLVGLGKKRIVRAVDGVSFEVPHACTLGIVGESGSGKSTLAKTIVGLQPLTGGTTHFMGFDISLPVKQRDLQLMQTIQMVFQNPDSTLNPSFTVGQQIARPLQRFRLVPSHKVHEEVIKLLSDVKLDASYYDRLPRQLSGGEKQRVSIARAFAARPDLVLCDEPVSSLDVSVQAAVLNLLLAIQKENATTMLFIAHDLSVVRFFSDYVAVMYLGKICELGRAEAIYCPPYHPYTEALLSAVPIPDPSVQQKCIRLEGIVPSAIDIPRGCRFHTRCPRKLGEICEQEEPLLRVAGPEHQIACHIPLEELSLVEPVVTPTRQPMI